MGAVRKSKGESGLAKLYVTQSKACKILQLNLPNFRRLCILKGVYPRAPKHRTKAQGGDSKIKILYLKRDITYLTHEPIIWKFREEKIHRRNVSHLKGKGYLKESSIKKHYHKPTFTLDHIVLERYPVFKKALDDLDDALSTCFVYGALPNEKRIDGELVHLCKKLTTEFLTYIIETRSLTKAFITIKGYYYRALIQGVNVTWMIPHPFPIYGSKEVEIRIMRTFVEFYTTLLGFVNYKLFNSLNVVYPLKPEKKAKKSPFTSYFEMKGSTLESLNAPIKRTFIEQDNDDDQYEDDILDKTFGKKLKLGFEEKQKIKAQKVLFNDMKFFLGRETNKESLTLVIRSAGGQVSWDSTLGAGATYPEDDSSILYQIVDRPEVEKKYLNRSYIQPQWVYDSFNAGILVPVQRYFVGAELPAHLSPFEETYHKSYVPPEMERLRALKEEIELVGDKAMVGDEEEDEGDEGEGEGFGDMEEEANEEQSDALEEATQSKTKKSVLKDLNDPMANMRVRRGKAVKPISKFQKHLDEREDFRLAASLIHRKQKRLFKKILFKEKKSEKYAHDLMGKRKIYELEVSKRRKLATKGGQNVSKKSQ